MRVQLEYAQVNIRVVRASRIRARNLQLFFLPTEPLIRESDNRITRYFIILLSMIEQN